MDNGKFAAKRLKISHPSDEIILDSESYGRLKDFRDKIVGQDVNLIYDVIWSGTIPLKDFVVSANGQHRIRFCMFDEAIENLENAPAGKVAMVGCVQELGYNHFWVLGVAKGEERADISLEMYDQEGNLAKKVTQPKILNLIRELWKIWHGVQLALLHPKVKEVFENPKTAKEYTREKDSTGKRRRVVRYYKRHVIDGEDMQRQMKEINRHCLSWYVVGHWRHLKDGRVTYVRGHWRGEMRAMKKNIDKGRERELVI